MNEKLKSIFICIGTFLSGIVTCLLGIFIHNNRKSDDGVKADTDKLSDIGNELQDTSTELHGLDEQFAGNNEQLSSNSSRLETLIGEIEKTKSEN